MGSFFLYRVGQGCLLSNHCADVTTIKINNHMCNASFVYQGNDIHSLHYTYGWLFIFIRNL